MRVFWSATRRVVSLLSFGEWEHARNAAVFQQGGASAKDIHALRFDRVGGYSARIGKWMGGSCTTQWSGAFMGCLSIARP